MNTTLKGDLFEQRAYNAISTVIQKGELALLPDYCRIYQKKAYYSKERESEIIFDMSIEVWLPNSTNYHLLYLIECKDYTNIAVPVNDVEEFVSHINQVAGKNVKGIFITTNRLQKGAYNIAKSNGLMLIELDSQNSLKFILHNKDRRSSLLVDEPVYSQNQDLLNQLELLNNEQYSLIYNWDLLIEYLIQGSLHQPQKNSLSDEEMSGIQHLSSSIIEDVATKMVEDIDNSILPNFKAIDSFALLEYVKKTYGLEVISDEPIPSKKGAKLNGYCDMGNKRIYLDKEVGVGQYLFVCAHEIAHYLLHSKVKFSQELYDGLLDSQYDHKTKRYTLSNDKNWLEWQANQFAAALIMPKRCILGRLIIWQKKHGMRNLGKVWLDSQPCNILDFQMMITQLAYHFKVSRQILEYRMADLGIINYKGGKNKSLFGYSKQPERVGNILTRMYGDI